MAAFFSHSMNYRCHTLWITLDGWCLMEHMEGAEPPFHPPSLCPPPEAGTLWSRELRNLGEDSWLDLILCQSHQLGLWPTKRRRSARPCLLGPVKTKGCFPAPLRPARASFVWSSFTPFVWLMTSSLWQLLTWCLGGIRPCYCVELQDSPSRLVQENQRKEWERNIDNQHPNNVN